LSYIFISHDLGVVRRFAHRIIVMKDGRIVESGDTDQLFTAATEPYTRTLLQALLRPKWELSPATVPHA
jgi:peptide/nickel transport system ATP-binding protein